MSTFWLWKSLLLLSCHKTVMVYHWSYFTIFLNLSALNMILIAALSSKAF